MRRGQDEQAIAGLEAVGPQVGTCSAPAAQVNTINSER